MPYVKSSRVTGSHVIEDHGVTGDLGGRRMDTATGYEFTYSFRTGKGTRLQDSDQPAKLDPASEVYNPTGNIADRLAYRKRFIERQIDLVHSRAGAPTHFLLGDVGHEFGNLKIDISSSKNTINYEPYFRRRAVNVVPTAFRLYSGTTGLLVPAYGAIDMFDGYFASKGSPVSHQNVSLGPTQSGIRGMASRHISEMDPFRAKASVLSTILELARGDIPGILTSLRKHMITIQGVKASGLAGAGKALGSEYLNNVFGWSPIIRDVDRAIRLLLEIDNALFPTDSTRRQVRRVISQRGDIFTGVIPMMSASPFAGQGTISSAPKLWYNSRSVYGYDNDVPTLGAAVFRGQNSVLETYSLWSTARFNTGMRPSPTNNGHLDRAIELLGLELTPAVLWELTPWSWLIDWFSNTGTLIKNLSTLGMSNTILNYAYTTARLKTTSSVWVKPDIVAVGSGYNGVNGFTGNFIYQMTVDAKLRIAASPFGFDVSPGSLSSGQWAILAALGLARSR